MNADNTNAALDTVPRRRALEACLVYIYIYIYIYIFVFCCIYLLYYRLRMIYSRIYHIYIHMLLVLVVPNNATID